MSNEPALEQVLAAAETQLATIVNPRAWGSYPRDPIIAREDKTFEEITEWPTILLIVGEREWSFDTTGSPGKIVIRHGFEFDALAFVQGDDTTPADTWLQRITDDITRALVAHQNLGINFAGIDGRELLTVSFGKTLFYPRLTTSSGVLFAAVAQPVRVDLTEEVAAA